MLHKQICFFKYYNGKKFELLCRDPIFCTAQQMSLEMYRRNYYKVMKLMEGLPHILAAIASLKLPVLRR